MRPRRPDTTGAASSFEGDAFERTPSLHRHRDRQANASSGGNCGGEAAAAAAALAHLIHLPTRACVSDAAAAAGDGEAPAALVALWASAIRGARALAKAKRPPAAAAAAAGPYALFAGLKDTPPPKGSEGQVTELAAWADTVAADLGASLLQPGGGSGVLCGLTWLQVASGDALPSFDGQGGDGSGGASLVGLESAAAAARPLLLTALAAATTTGTTAAAAPLTVLLAVLPGLGAAAPPPPLPPPHAASPSSMAVAGGSAKKRKQQQKQQQQAAARASRRPRSVAAETTAASLVLLAKVVKHLPPGHPALLATGGGRGGVCAHLLRLPAATYRHPCVEEALRAVLSRHCGGAPLQPLARAFAAPWGQGGGGGEGAAAATARVRGLALALSFVDAVKGKLRLGGGERAADEGAQAASAKKKAKKKDGGGGGGGGGSAALEDMALLWPHVVTVLEHPAQPVRQAALALLGAIRECSHMAASAAAAKAVAIQVSPLLKVSPSPEVPALRAADLAAMSAMVLTRGAEISMDAGLVGPCLLSMFGEDTATDKEWLKARVGCLEYLLASAAQLGFGAEADAQYRGGHSHVSSRFVQLLAWRGVGAARDQSVLGTHAALAWARFLPLAQHILASPSPEGGSGAVAVDVAAAASSAASHASGRFLCTVLGALVFSPPPLPEGGARGGGEGVAAAPFDLVTSLLKAAAAAARAELVAPARFVLRSLPSSDWVGRLSEAQARHLFDALLALGGGGGGGVDRSSPPAATAASSEGLATGGDGPFQGDDLVGVLGSLRLSPAAYADKVRDAAAALPPPAAAAGGGEGSSSGSSRRGAALAEAALLLEAGNSSASAAVAQGPAAVAQVVDALFGLVQRCQGTKGEGEDAMEVEEEEEEEGTEGTGYVEGLALGLVVLLLSGGAKDDGGEGDDGETEEQAAAAAAAAALAPRVPAYTSLLRSYVVAGPSAALRQAACRALAAMARLAPATVLSTVQAVVKATVARLGGGGASSSGGQAADDFELYGTVEQLVRGVLPHLQQPALDQRLTAGAFLTDLAPLLRRGGGGGGGGTQQRAALGMAACLLQSLGPAVLPALLLLVEPADTAHALAHRSPPAVQLAANLKLLECVDKCNRAAAAAAAAAALEPPRSAAKKKKAKEAKEGEDGLLCVQLGEDPTDAFLRLDLAALLRADALGGGGGGGGAEARHEGVEEPGRALRALALRCASFVAEHTATRALHVQLLRLSPGDERAVQTLHLRVCQHALLGMRDLSAAAAASPGLGGALELVLEHTQRLLSVSGFVAVTQELLQDDEVRVRRKALELLTSRLHAMGRDSASGSGMSRNEAQLFVDMLPELTASLGSGGGGEHLPTALCAMEILARDLSSHAPAAFVDALAHVTDLLDRLGPNAVRMARPSSGAKAAAAAEEEEEEEDATPLVMAAYVCAATLCSVLGTRTFPYLPKLIGRALSHLELFADDDAGAAASLADAATSSDPRPTMCLRSLLSLLVALAQRLPQFLGPYAARILALAFRVGPKARAASAPLASLLEKLERHLAEGLPVRLLLPTVRALYPDAVATGPFAAKRLLVVFTAMVSATSLGDVAVHRTQMAAFVQHALQFREEQQPPREEGGGADAAWSYSVEEVEDTESAVVAALLALVLRMNEGGLTSFFVDLVEWKLALRPDGGGDPGTAGRSLCRRVAFYHAVDVLANELKSIFVPLFEHFFDDSRGELEALFQPHPADVVAVSKGKSQKKKQRVSRGGGEMRDSDAAAQYMAGLAPPQRHLQVRLFTWVVSSLVKCFAHDTGGGGSSWSVSGAGAKAFFMTKDRVKAVTEPLVRHLALAPCEPAYVNEGVVPAIANLALAAQGDEVLWKPLNFAVLLSTRDGGAPAVRLAALAALHECFSLVGEEYLAMLPESLSFLSELLEDSDPLVEKKCRDVLKFVEDLSGEKLDTYL